MHKIGYYLFLALGIFFSTTALLRFFIGGDDVGASCAMSIACFAYAEILELKRKLL